MTTDTDKLIQVAEAAGFRVVRFNDAAAYACDDEGKDITPKLAGFRTAIIADLCGDVEPVMWVISDSQGFYEPRYSEANAREFCDRYNARTEDPLKPYSYEPVYSASTVAALKAEHDALRARVAELEKDAARYRWLRQEHERFDPLCHLSWKAGGDRNSSEWVNTAVLDSSIDAAITKGQQ